jgi:hypothetical protein
VTPSESQPTSSNQYESNSVTYHVRIIDRVESSSPPTQVGSDQPTREELISAEQLRMEAGSNSSTREIDVQNIEGDN